MNWRGRIAIKPRPEPTSALHESVGHSTMITIKPGTGATVSVRAQEKAHRACIWPRRRALQPKFPLLILMLGKNISAKGLRLYPGASF